MHAGCVRVSLPSIIIEDSMATSFPSTSRFSQSKYSSASFWEASWLSTCFRLWIPANGNSGFRADAPVVAQKKNRSDPFRKTSASNRNFAHSQKQKFIIPPRKSLYQNNASLVSKFLGDSRNPEISNALLRAQKRPSLSFFVAWLVVEVLWLLRRVFFREGSVPKYFHDFHCRVSRDWRSA